MNREDRLKYCKICTKRLFISEKGIVCSLTNEHASFNKYCKEFKEDLILKSVLEKQRIENEKEEIEEESLGLSSLGIKNGVLAGQIAIIGAILWLIIGVIYLDRIFFYPFALIAIGIVAWNKGTKRRKKEQKFN